MKKTFISVLSVLAVLVPAQAQRVSPENILDLGKVQFYKPIEAVFELTNTTSETLAIDRIDTGCGCTKADYPTDAVAPGEKYNINVIYDARTMGHFDRIIDVYANNSATPFLIELRGQVVETVEHDYFPPSTVSSLAEQQLPPEKVGDLYADCNYIEFEDVHIGEVFQQRFRIYNPTDQTVQPQLMHLPSYITAKISPSRLMPHRLAEVTLTFDSSEGITEGDVGLMQNVIYLGTNPGDKVGQEKALTISAVITPSIESEQTADLAHAPRISLSTDVVKAKISKGKKKSETIIVKNTGHGTLEIKRLQTFTPGLEVSLESTRIAPGESAKMKVSVTPKEFRRKGAAPRILLVTNDPEHSTVFINIKDEN